MNRSYFSLPTFLLGIFPYIKIHFPITAPYLIGVQILWFLTYTTLLKEMVHQVYLFFTEYFLWPCFIYNDLDWVVECEWADNDTHMFIALWSLVITIECWHNSQQLARLTTKAVSDSIRQYNNWSDIPLLQLKGTHLPLGNKIWQGFEQFPQKDYQRIEYINK